MLPRWGSGLSFPPAESSAGEQLRSGGHQFDLIAVDVDEVGSVVIAASSERVPVGEYQRPAMEWARTGKRVDVTACTQLGKQPVPLHHGAIAMSGTHTSTWCSVPIAARSQGT